MTAKEANKITSSISKHSYELSQKPKQNFFVLYSPTDKYGNVYFYIEASSLGNSSTFKYFQKDEAIQQTSSQSGGGSYNNLMFKPRLPSRSNKYLKGKWSRKKLLKVVFKEDLSSTSSSLFLSTNCILCRKETIFIPNESICGRHAYCIQMDIKVRKMVDMISICYTIVAFDRQENDVSQYLIDLLRNPGNANICAKLSSKNLSAVTSSSSAEEYFNFSAMVLQDATTTAVQSIERKMQQGERKTIIPENVLLALVEAQLLLNVNPTDIINRSVENRFQVFIADKSNKIGKFLQSCNQLFTNKNTKEDHPRYIMVSTEIFDEALRTAARQLNPDEPVVMYEHVLVQNPVDGERTEELAYIIYHPDDCRLFIFIPTLRGSYLDIKERIRRL